MVRPPRGHWSFPKFALDKFSLDGVVLRQIQELLGRHRALCRDNAHLVTPFDSIIAPPPHYHLANRSGRARSQHMIT
jgi:hypothetical protein